MNGIKLTKKFVWGKVKKYLDYLNDGIRFDRTTENTIEFGLDIVTTTTDNLIFDIYDVKGIYNDKVWQLRVWVDCATFDYKIKPIMVHDGDGQFYELDEKLDKYYNVGGIKRRNQLRGVKKIVVEGLIANTLWQCFYGEDCIAHPICDLFDIDDSQWEEKFF